MIKDMETKTIGADISESDSGSIETKREKDEQDTFTKSRTKRIIILFSLFLSIFFSQYPHVGISPSIAKIADDLNDLTNMSWYMTSFTLVSVIFQMLGVRISDCLGRRRTALSSMVLFIFISLLAGFSRNSGMFIACRAIEGMATGILQSTMFTALVDLFSMRDRLKYQPRVSMAFSLSVIISPVICGILIDRVSWGWVFWIIPIGCFPILISLYFYLQIPIKPEQTLSKENLKTLRRRADPIGCLLISTGLSFFLIGMHLASASIGYTWSSPIVIGFICGSVGVFVLFLIYEKFVTSFPLFPSAIVLDKNLLFCYFQQFSLGWQYPFFDLVLFIEYQAVFNATATEAAYRIIPGAIASAIASFIGSRICYKLGKPKLINMAGLIIMIFGQILLLFVQNPSSNVVVQSVIVVIYQVGISWADQNNILSAQMILDQTHPHLTPLSISLSRCLLVCGTTCSISFSLSFLQSRLSAEMENLRHAQPGIYNIIQSYDAQINYTKVREITSETAKSTIQQMYHKNIRYIIYSNLALTAISLIGTFFERVPNIKEKEIVDDIEKK